MAVTTLADVIVPEVWVPYVQQQTTEKSALVQSGIISSSPELDNLVTQGGKLINMPFFNDLTGDDQVVPPQGTSLAVDKITTGQDVAVLLIRGKAWGAHELAGALAGADPMQAIANRYVAWWTRQEQKVLINILTGVFGTALASHVNDISTGTGDAAVISGGAVLDTKQALGDAGRRPDGADYALRRLYHPPEAEPDRLYSQCPRGSQYSHLSGIPSDHRRRRPGERSGR